ncbi:peptide/nickel transport system ATP-binding protein [Leeuwenhoekiella aestuarii]|uniref:Peptide/nickel transport system ATP-binding protein n=1 Tax=Leeuwenhoekiella aestuarii TaxID=2249426 RepID=A0A4Q0NY89_9FLAO|nr:ABC transporter ATP-binding protein [Leeuwenhoekiella aestuarii]RXG17870.1 peptide/nickel transport system ATP-binding protein [Leeuwenhoekiella aestuarii]RXG19199.1 peptide/nickel transport system ATP-binding protein [Leeuwenhoekiella aestuarii]
MNKTALLSVENLSIGFKAGNRLNQVLHNINFDVYKNEIVGVVGESGSGKSVTNLAVLGLLPKRISEVISGKIIFEGKDLLTYSDKQLQKIRGNAISMIFQEPMSSLNPSMRCGRQVTEILKRHQQISNEAAKAETLRLFEQVKLPRPISVFKAYPHEISGGQKQRVMIAMAIACKPQLLIADEPTTALDVTVQKEIILLLKELQQQTAMSILFISHDLSLVSEIADRVLVMYRGKIVERGSATSIFKNPQEDYTKALIYARPSTTERLSKLPTVADFLSGKPLAQAVSSQSREKQHQDIYSKSPLLEIKNAQKEYYSKVSFFGKTETVKAVNNVSFKIYEGETLGLVGESGCGKSTLGNLILQLDKATSGSIFYNGKDLTKLKSNELRKLRKDIQIIFQDPYSSLNPRLTVGQSITEAMQVHKLYGSKKERKAEALKLLQQVGLMPEHYDRYPHEFSGGQRQRIGIARTIAVKPKFIVCDESVSALDISVQAQVLNLLNELKETYQFTYLFISHDLAVVKYISDRLLVMRNGQFEETGEADAVYANPESAYTRELIDAIPKGI